MGCAFNVRLWNDKKSYISGDSYVFEPLFKMLGVMTSMRRELQSQNRVNGDYEKTTGPIYLKF